MNLDKNLHHLRGKWGFFYEYFSKNLDEIKNSDYARSKYNAELKIKEIFLYNLLIVATQYC